MEKESDVERECETRGKSDLNEESCLHTCYASGY